MSIEKRLNGVARTLKDLENYRDVDGFVTDLEYLVGQLTYFYNRLTPRQTGDPSTTFYKPKKLPKPHQVAYFNLTRGFPKELYGGHWCYVLKYFKSKFIIIPTTSVKRNSLKADPDFQIDIKVKNFKNGLTTRMQISDMRTVDAQRLYFNKGFYDVITEKKYICEEMNKILSL